MKIDFSKCITTMDGEAFKRPDGKTDMDLGYVAMTALTGLTDKDKNLSGDDKFKLGILAQEVYNQAKVDVTLEDAATIKKRIGDAYGPAVVVSAFNLLEE